MSFFLLRKVGNYTTYGIPIILKDLGNMEYNKKIKNGRKLSQQVFGIHQYIKGGRITKQNWTYDLFNNILREIENMKNICYKRQEIIPMDIWNLPIY